jgi:hypothetical protein
MYKMKSAIFCTGFPREQDRTEEAGNNTYRLGSPARDVLIQSFQRLAELAAEPDLDEADADALGG